MSEEQQALSLNWVFGSSINVKNNIVNLSDGFSERLCYIAAHTAVIYDKRTRRQLFLQGHCNAITCLAATSDRSVVITADVGNESLLVLWSTKTGVPIRSIPQPHKYGTVAMDISPAGDWLATVSAPDPETGEQEIALWSIAAISAGGPGSNTVVARPSVLTAIPAGDVQLSVRFNMNNPNELISNGKRRVYFWTHQFPSSQRFKYYSPPLRSKDFKQAVGDFVMSVFVPGSMQALTATTDGDLVVWDEQGITAQMGTRATDRRAVKLMRIHSGAISFLGTVGDCIVSGGQEGHVRFYDPLLRIVAWFEDIEAGAVTGVSFSLALPDRVPAGELADTLNRFIVPDFVVATEESKIVAMQCSMFEEYEVEKRRGQLILDTMLTDVVDVVAHPTRAEFAVLGGASGRLQRWDMVTHTCLGSRAFPKMTGTKVAYSRDGAFMVAGFEGGYVHIVSTEGDMQDIHVTRNTASRITLVACSSTGDQVAATDDLGHVMLYSYVPYKHIMRWEYIGKSKAHHAKVVGLNFGESPSGQTRLFSLGSDGRVAEYDLAGSSPAAGLKMSNYKDLQGPSVPTALAFAPPLQYYKHHSADTQLLVCDDAYKVKVYNPDRQAVVATFLGPTFGGPINHLVMFKSATSESAFLAYSTSERVVGLLAWPMDGDPAKTMGLIAHPGAVGSISISYDGRKLITAGADATLNLWDISTTVLEASAAAADKQAGRWQRVIGDDALLSDLKDYFYFAQVKAQGEESMEPRSITGRVPITMVPDLLRAAGYYPSEEDVGAILSHIAFMAHARDLEALDEISFDDLLELYVNHRPLVDVNQEDIEKAFEALAGNPSGRVARDQLVALLQQLGEPLLDKELLQSLQVLTGAGRVADALPALVDPNSFSADILGFEAAAAEGEVPQ